MSDCYVAMNHSAYIKDHDPWFVNFTGRLQTARATGVQISHFDDSATTATYGYCAEPFSTGKRRKLICQE
jgi:hypothetical protein